MAHKEKENDALTDLFRTHLAGAEMVVHDGFWEALSQEIPMACRQRRRLLLYRSVAAASVLLVLAVVSATFLYLFPRQELAEAFSLVEARQLKGDRTSFHRLPEPVEPLSSHSLVTPHRQIFASQEKADSVDVTISLSFSFSATAVAEGSYAPHAQEEYRQVSLESKEWKEEVAKRQMAVDVCAGRDVQPLWAWKAMAGIALPVTNSAYKLPLASGLTVERKLTDGVSIEAGVLYSSLHATTGEHLHMLGIPMKLNVDLCEQDRWQFYASVGGMADKCVAGASDNGFGAEPIQFSLMAGMGVRYRVGEKLALFAEPAVVHHFHTSSKLSTLRTDNPTLFQMMCGIRMTY